MTKRSFSAAFKLSMVEYAEKFGNRAAGRRCRIDESTIRRWRADKPKLESMPKHMKSRMSARWPALEEKLLRWVKERQAAGHAVSTKALRNQAMVIAKETNVTKFLGSVSWVFHFVHKYNLPSIGKHSHNIGKPQRKCGTKDDNCEDVVAPDSDDDPNSDEDELAFQPKKTGSMTRRSFTAAFKLSVFAYAEKFGNRAAGRRFGVNESTIRRWRGDKALLESMPKYKKASRGKVARWPALEKKLLKWVKERQTAGHAVSTKALRNQAMVIAKETNATNFGGSISWIFRFVHKYDLSSIGKHGRNIGNPQRKCGNEDDNFEDVVAPDPDDDAAPDPDDDADYDEDELACMWR
ncbi:uncharacterized protein [Diadema antillarum]|uniref:uncharacterized protein n=1 Tax=Diadema antillarum TaxID=105358 RepID=UPI003A8A6235